MLCLDARRLPSRAEEDGDDAASDEVDLVVGRIQRERGLKVCDAKTRWLVGYLATLNEVRTSIRFDETILSEECGSSQQQQLRVGRLHSKSESAVANDD